MRRVTSQLATSVPELSYPWGDPPGTGSVKEIVPGIFWIRMPLPFALNHINLWLLADGAGWTILDCGYATDVARRAWEQIFARHLRERPVTRLIVSHYHPDHIGLCGWLTEKFNLLPWMARAEYLQAHTILNRTAGTSQAALEALHQRHGLERSQLLAIRTPDDHYRHGVCALPNAFRRIKHDEEIEIGGNIWRVIAGYGHAPEHAAFHCQKLGVLISGDMLLPRISTNVSVWPMEPEGDPLHEFLTSLDRFVALDPQTLVLPSHGLPFRGMHHRISELNRHHQVRLDKLLDVCEQPQSAAQSLPTLFDRHFDNYQLYFAMGEAIAHLNYLMHRGAVTRTEDATGVYRFARRAAVVKGTL